MPFYHNHHKNVLWLRPFCSHNFATLCLASKMLENLVLNNSSYEHLTDEQYQQQQKLRVVAWQFYFREYAVWYQQQCSELAHRKDVAHIEKMGKRKLTVESPVNLDIRTDRVVALVEFRAPITWRVRLRCSFLPTHNVIKILWKKIYHRKKIFIGIQIVLCR